MNAARNTFWISLLACCTLAAPGMATVQAQWLVGKAGQSPESDATLAMSAHTEITFLIPSFPSIQIPCAKAEADPENPMSLLKGSSEAVGYLNLSECKMWNFKKTEESKVCRPQEPILFGGVLLLVLHPDNGKNYLLLEQAIGEPLGVLEFNELCVFKPEVPITGRVVFECGHLAAVFVSLDCGTLQSTQLMRPVNPALFPADKLGFDELVEGFMDGILAAKISAPKYAGMAWGGHV
jgi:hypothetical protein